MAERGATARNPRSGFEPRCPPRRRKARFAEMAGQKAAECAAIFCCCPCGLLSLLVSAVVRLPAALVHHSIRRRRRRRKTTPVLLRPKAVVGFSDDDEDEVFRIQFHAWPARPPSAEESELDKEMMARFSSAGFWRSLSQRE